MQVVGIVVALDNLRSWLVAHSRTRPDWPAEADRRLDFDIELGFGIEADIELREVELEVVEGRPADIVVVDMPVVVKVLRIVAIHIEIAGAELGGHIEPDLIRIEQGRIEGQMVHIAVVAVVHTAEAHTAGIGLGHIERARDRIEREQLGHGPEEERLGLEQGLGCKLIQI